MLTPSIEPPASLSALGRANETPNRHLGGSHHPQQHQSSYHSSKVKLRPWDGVALVDAVLADAQRSHIASLAPREVLHTSSPRVNPTLILRDETEAVEGIVHSFLLKMAKDVPEAATHAPALIAAASASVPSRASSAAADDAVEYAASSPSPTQRRSVKKSRKPGMGGNLSSIIQQRFAQSRAASASLSDLHGSATELHSQSSCFLAPAVRDRIPKAKAPAVGQYTPKFHVILRKGPAATMGKAARDIQEGNHHAAAASSARSPTPAAASNKVNSPPNATPAALTGSPSSRVAPSPGIVASTPALDSEEGMTDRKPRKVGTASFLSCSERFKAPKPAYANTNHVAPWPLPLPGSRPQTAGTFSSLERPSTFVGKSGPDAMLDPVHIDRARSRTPCFVAMSRQTNRDTQRGTRQLVHADLAEGLELRVEPEAMNRTLSTFSRPATPIQFDKQIKRPMTATLPERQPLPAPKLDSPRGFVDISRMVYSNERMLMGDPAHDHRGVEILTPTYDLVLNRAPTPTFGKAPRDTGMIAASAKDQLRATSPPRHNVSGQSTLPPRGPVATNLSRPVSPATQRTTGGGVGMDTLDGDLEQHWSSVRRRAPAVSLKGTDRTAPIMRTKQDPSPATPHDQRPPDRIPSPDLSRGLSRSVRDLRFKVARAIDVVYEVPQHHPVGGALEFDKYTGRP